MTSLAKRGDFGEPVTIILAVAGLISTAVGAGAKRKGARRAAVEWARAEGVPDPDRVPGFILRMSRKSLSKLRKRLKKLKRKASGSGFLGLRTKKRKRKIASKVEILKAIIHVRVSEANSARGREKAPSVDDSADDRSAEKTDLDVRSQPERTVYVVGAVAVVGVVAYLLSRSSRRSR